MNGVTGVAAQQPKETRPQAGGVGPGEPAVGQKPGVNPAKPAEKQRPLAEDVQKAAERLNQAASAFDIQAHFSVHRATHEIMVKIVNTRTGQVLREIPPEKVLDLAASMEQMLGLFVDERA